MNAYVVKGTALPLIWYEVNYLHATITAGNLFDEAIEAIAPPRERLVDEVDIAAFRLKLENEIIAVAPVPSLIPSTQFFQVCEEMHVRLDEAFSFERVEAMRASRGPVKVGRLTWPSACRAVAEIGAITFMYAVDSEAKTPQEKGPVHELFDFVQSIVRYRYCKAALKNRRPGESLRVEGWGSEYRDFRVEGWGSEYRDFRVQGTVRAIAAILNHLKGEDYVNVASELRLELAAVAGPATSDRSSPPAPKDSPAPAGAAGSNGQGMA